MANFTIRQLRDCPECAAWMRKHGSTFGTDRYHEQFIDWGKPDHKWKHITLAGRKWHKFITTKADK